MAERSRIAAVQMPTHASPPSVDPSAAAGGILTVDLAAVAGNYATLRRRAPTAQVAAVVKADAYGLGVARVAPALHAAGCRTFFVAHVEEGLALRHVLADACDIIVLHGAPPGTEQACIEAGLTPVLNGWEQLKAWRNGAARSLPRIVQFDTGMARFGFPIEEAGAVRDALAAAGLQASLIMSHLACADDPNHPESPRQLQRLLGVKPYFPGAALSLAASSGLFLGDAYHLDMVRPGAALFGVSPVRDGANPMAPVVRLQGRVVQCRTVPAGTGVGYGHVDHVAHATRLATVSIGYADGFLRSVSGRAAAWLGDTRLPLVGRVSMDSIVLDVGALGEDGLRPGDLVDIIGPHYGVDDAAAAAGTIGYEILTSLGRRYWRRYIDTRGQ